MNFEEDYIMRMIKDMVKALASVVLGRRFTEYEVEEEKPVTRIFSTGILSKWQTREKLMRRKIYFSQIWTSLTADTWRWL